jgi:hypothetical protein
VPEFAEGRADIWFRVAAEFGAAVLLVVAGAVCLRAHRQAPLLGAFALGCGRLT